jgi:hypothetical protein
LPDFRLMNIGKQPNLQPDADSKVRQESDHSFVEI